MSIIHNKAQAEEVVTFAKQFVGKPYKYGASMDEAPDFFDCSSFVKYVFAHVGVELPRSSILQATDTTGMEIPSITEAQPGDLFFMRSTKGYYDDEAFNGRKLSIGHVGIYCGDNMFLHAKSSFGGVVFQNVSELQQDPNYAIALIKRFT